MSHLFAFILGAAVALGIIAGTDHMRKPEPKCAVIERVEVFVRTSGGWHVKTRAETTYVDCDSILVDKGAL